jgi:hypothetical protein
LRFKNIHFTDGLQELKVFVDLAYISTGDDGIEIAKVRCLQSAAIGYAPLIFNLDPNCDYQVFLDRCKEVWKALDSNPNLPNELVSEFDRQSLDHNYYMFHIYLPRYSVVTGYSLH